MAFDREKFKAMVHCICWKTSENPSSLGGTKLNKACWLADFVAYYNTGEPITGAAYIKRQFGPVPRPILSTLRDLEAGGIVVSSTKTFHGYPQTQFVAQYEPDLSLFTQDELDLIERATAYVTEQHTAKSISELSHDHVWKAAKDGEEIPYFTIFANPAPITDSERQWALQELEAIAN